LERCAPASSPKRNSKKLIAARPSREGGMPAPPAERRIAANVLHSNRNLDGAAIGATGSMCT